MRHGEAGYGAPRSFSGGRSVHVGTGRALTLASRVAGVLIALAILLAPVSTASARARPSPGSRLRAYLWDYGHWLLRPYVSAVSLSGGHVIVVSGQPRLTGATGNVYETLEDQPSNTPAAQVICRIASAGAQKLHLRMVTAIQVWSADGHAVARC